MTPARAIRTFGVMLFFFGAPGRAQNAAAAPGGDAPRPSESAPSAVDAAAKPTQPKASAESDGWPDLSAFLDEKFGFLPVAMPITEPAIGYGAVGGLAFLSKSLGDASTA